MDTFKKLMDLKAEYDKTLSEQGEQALKEAFKEFFTKHPQVGTISWTQYTPYFNDGDACYFSRHELEIDEEDDEDYDDDDGEEGEEQEEVAAEPVEDATLWDDLMKLEDIPDDVYESVFGDHARIVATPDQFEVTEYDHD